MSIVDEPPGTNPALPLRRVAVGAVTCLSIVLATVATINEPEEPEPPCWYE